MKELVSLRVGGVPEHFNLPWHLAMEDRAFVDQGVALEWEDFPGGTGAMTKALRSQDLDVAVVLTEGIVTDISKGNPSKIISLFVRSPLIWGIHTGANSPFKYATDLKNQRFAISRKGSGSHLISYLYARKQKWNLEELNFVPVGNLDGARASLTALESDGFLWEKFTTKPYVDNGEMRRIGVIRTPWPCFVIAATEKAIREKPEQLEVLLKTIRSYSKSLMYRPDAIPLIASRYKLKEEDVLKWFGQTQWSTDGLIAKPVLQNVITILKEVGRIEGELEVDDLCGEFIQFNY